MSCPKCGFAEAEGASCPRCGVVFAKLGQPRPSRPPPPTEAALPSQRDSLGRSLGNVLVLTACFAALGVAAWYVSQAPAPDPERGTPFAPGSARTARSEPPSEKVAPTQDGDLSLPMPSVASSTEVVGPPKIVDVPFPTLNSRTITPEVVREAVAVAEKYPEVAAVRERAARAHLMLAQRQITEGRPHDALLVLNQAKRFEPDPRELARTFAIAYLALREPKEALEWAQAALAFGPDADMYDVLGHVYYLRQELPRAIEAWQNSLALREHPDVRAALERALREGRVEAGLDEKRLAHFIVRYEGETMEDTGRLVLDSLERSYVSIKSMLGFEPSERVVVILLTRQDYAALGGPYWSAGRFDGKVRVPVRGLTNLDRHVEATLKHELTHAFIFARAGEGCPRWLQEGMAEYSQGARASEFGRRLAERLEADDSILYCLASNNYCDVSYFYPAATSVVEYLLANRGMGGIRDLLDDLGRGNDIDRALGTLMGRNQMELLRDWKRWAVRR